MQENFTEMVFLLDKSGSMQGLEQDTIGGFNSMLAKQRQQEGAAYVTTVLFSDKSLVIHDRVAIEQVEPLSEKDYQAVGCTALLDALGGTMEHIFHLQQGSAGRPQQTLFVIITDGYENASVEYRYQEVKHLLNNAKEQYGWEFLFLGANIDVAEEADRLGIGRKRAMKFSCCTQEITSNFAAINACFEVVRTEKVLSDKEIEQIKQRYNK